MKPFEYLKANNLNEALTKKSSNAQYIAGGSNIVELMKKNIVQPDEVIDLNGVLSNELQDDGDKITVGASMSNDDFAHHPKVLSSYPLISKAILAGASAQIRNMASVGGNLLQKTRCAYYHDTTTPCNKRTADSGCSAQNTNQRLNSIVGFSDKCIAVHPSDMCVALAALDTKVNVRDKSGKSSNIDFLNFHRLPANTPQVDNNLPSHSIITSITVKANPYSKHCAYVKIRDRDSYAFALVSVAAGLELSGQKIISARLASGGVAHKPWRWIEAEKYLAGKTADSQTFTAVADLIVKSLNPQEKMKFKLPLLKGAIETALQDCLKA